MPKFDIRSWVEGRNQALLGNPLRKTAKQPIAYSYNGVVLPGLPEWDREMYPYAAITDVNLWRRPHHLMICTAPFSVFTNDDTTITFISGTEEDAPLLRYEYNSENNSWEVFNPTSTDKTWGPSSSYEPPIWTNADIISRDDGTLYLAASDPIPVYE